MKSFKQFLRERSWLLPKLDRVIVAPASGAIDLYEGRKWVSGRFDRSIGIDQHTHGVGQTHAHVSGRRNNEIVLIVNLDGTGSHGSKGRLSDDDADALRARGFSIAANNIVEWVEVIEQPSVLLA